MTTNKKIVLGALFIGAGLTCTPLLTHAAGFNLISQNGNGKAYTSVTPPVFKSVDIFTGMLVGGFAASMDPLASCNGAITAAGIPDTQDVYCVYDADERYLPIGAGFYGAGGPQPQTCFDNNNCPPAPIGIGYWPPLNALPDLSYNKNPFVSLYTSPLRERNLADTLTGPLKAYGDSQSIQKICPFLIAAGLTCPAPTANDPGYRDVCEISHQDDPDNQVIPGLLVYGPASACTIYHRTGAVVQLPLASVTANPSSVVAGGSSLLTYSCTNGATSASIDNGVGSVSATSPGSVSVTPGSTTTYTLTCTNSAGSKTADATVTIVPVLNASCSVSPTTAVTGQSVTWSASATGGTGIYGYSWSGTDSLSGTNSSVTASYSSSGTKTARVMVSSGSQSVPADCSNSVNVTPAPQADLTAGPVSPTSATVGSPVSLSASATNIGNAASDAFPLLFEIQSGPLLNSSYLAGLSPNASASGSVSHTFTTPGTYQVRACANYNTSWASIASESDYTNNCGPWTAVVVGSGAVIPPPPNNRTYSCNSSGTSVTLSWDAAPGASGYDVRFDDPTNNAPSCVDGWYCVEPPDHSTDNHPGTSITYNTLVPGRWYSWWIHSRNSAGVSNAVSGGGVMCPAPAAPTCSLTAGASSLSWTSTNATSCTGGGFSTGNATNGGPVSAAPGTYSLQCTGPGGSCTDTATVSGGTCTGSPNETITATPDRVRAGQTSTISWGATNVPGVNPTCTVSGPGVSRTYTAGAAPTCAIPNDSATPVINAQSVYTITCAGVSKSVTVNVLPAIIEF